MFKGEEQQAPPPVANVSFQIKRCASIGEKESTMICWGGPFKIGTKEWLATSTTSRGVVNVTNLQRIVEFPPKHSISTSNRLIHTF
jgi:hypothetical protein